MTEGVSSAETGATRWSVVAETFRRPYPVTVWMVLLVSLVPLYPFIGAAMLGKATTYPELPLDRMIPLHPSWVFVYGTLYLYLIVLPVLAIRQPEHIHRTVFAYLTAWITAYVFFILVPSEARRPDVVAGDGFSAWGLRFLYDADTPRNCFPSLHVAHSFISALSLGRLHRRVGAGAIGCASLVAISTLFTKQHYALDVIAGIALAGAAYLLFLRTYPRSAVPEGDRRAAAQLSAGLIALLALAHLAVWIGYAIAAS